SRPLPRRMAADRVGVGIAARAVVADRAAVGRADARVDGVPNGDAFHVVVPGDARAAAMGGGGAALLSTGAAAAADDGAGRAHSAQYCFLVGVRARGRGRARQRRSYFAAPGAGAAAARRNPRRGGHPDADQDRPLSLRAGPRILHAPRDAPVAMA